MCDAKRGRRKPEDAREREDHPTKPSRVFAGLICGASLAARRNGRSVGARVVGPDHEEERQHPPELVRAAAHLHRRASIRKRPSTSRDRTGSAIVSAQSISVRSIVGRVTISQVNESMMKALSRRSRGQLSRDSGQGDQSTRAATRKSRPRPSSKGQRVPATIGKHTRSSHMPRAARAPRRRRQSSRRRRPARSRWGSAHPPRAAAVQTERATLRVALAQQRRQATWRPRRRSGGPRRIWCPMRRRLAPAARGRVRGCCALPAHRACSIDAETHMV